jgi:DNA-binding response OmpR family regulator
MKLLADLGKNLPKASKKRSIPAPSAQSVDLRRTVLAIDDESDVLEMLTEILKSDGYIVLPAISVKEGITYLQSRSDISLILCDLVMPEEDGFAMLRFVRSNLRFRDIPIVVCTGLPSRTSVELALKLGAKDCIIKPFEAESFLHRIRTIIDSGLGTLLVVTDDESVSRILTGALSRVGYRIMKAPSGEKGLEILSAEPVDGILTDLVLPDMTGLDLLSGAQDKKPGIQALYIGDTQIDVTENDVVAAGGFGMLRKPFSNTEVARKVAQLLLARAK